MEGSGGGMGQGVVGLRDEGWGEVACVGVHGCDVLQDGVGGGEEGELWRKWGLWLSGVGGGVLGKVMGEEGGVEWDGGGGVWVKEEVRVGE